MALHSPTVHVNHNVSSPVSQDQHHSPSTIFPSPSSHHQLSNRSSLKVSLSASNPKPKGLSFSIEKLLESAAAASKQQNS